MSDDDFHTWLKGKWTSADTWNYRLMMVRFTAVCIPIEICNIMPTG
jgi:hypothetical protein